MLEWLEDPKVKRSDLFLDAKHPRGLSFVSHAHTDHLAPHARALMTRATARLSEARTPAVFSELCDYRINYPLSTELRLSLLPAGHVLGSAMAFVEADGIFPGKDNGPRSLLYTGDFKLRPGLTCPPAELCRADQLLMECTFGLPAFRFPSPGEVAARLCEAVHAALADGRQPLVFAYALGKAQEVTRVLTDAGIPVTALGAVARVNELYRELGVEVGPFRRYRREDFHGADALPLEERGVLLAPPNNARGTFTSSFAKRHTLMMSGWAMLPGAKYRYGVDDVLPMSDHADHSELWETIERVSPKVVWLHHGYVREFGEELRARGIDARPACPEAQLELF